MDINHIPDPFPGEPLEAYVDRVLPQSLPEKSMHIDLVKNGQIGFSLTLLNTPTDNHIASHTNYGQEFAISGDSQTLLRSLQNTLEALSRQNWHIVAIPESSIMRSEAPCWPTWASQQSCQVGQASSPSLKQTHNTAMATSCPQVPPTLQPPPPTDTAGMAQDPQPRTAKRRRLAPKQPEFHFTEREASLLRSFEAFQRRQETNAATIAADEFKGDYSGTGLCRWCGREGHEAVHCIKMDPTHFDKGVCVACNNKQHAIDQCDKFARVMTWEEQAALLVDAGAGKPGVRSYFYPWVCVVFVFEFPSLCLALSCQSILSDLCTQFLGPLSSLPFLLSYIDTLLIPLLFLPHNPAFSSSKDKPFVLTIHISCARRAICALTHPTHPPRSPEHVSSRPCTETPSFSSGGDTGTTRATPNRTSPGSARAREWVAVP